MWEVKFPYWRSLFCLKPIYISTSVFLPPKQTTPWEFPRRRRIMFVFLPRGGSKDMILEHLSRHYVTRLLILGGLYSLQPPLLRSSGACPPPPNCARLITYWMPLVHRTKGDFQRSYFLEDRTKINLAIDKTSTLFWVPIRTQTLRLRSSAILTLLPPHTVQSKQIKSSQRRAQQNHRWSVEPGGCKEPGGWRSLFCILPGGPPLS